MRGNPVSIRRSTSRDISILTRAAFRNAAAVPVWGVLESKAIGVRVVVFVEVDR